MDTQTQASASAYSLDHVPSSELHLSTRRLVGRSNQILAALLAHLGEIETDDQTCQLSSAFGVLAVILIQSFGGMSHQG
jgi:hypothetical protein